MNTTYEDITLALLNARKRRGGQHASSAKAELKATLKHVSSRKSFKKYLLF